MGIRNRLKNRVRKMVGRSAHETEASSTSSYDARGAWERQSTPGPELVHDTAAAAAPATTTKPTPPAAAPATSVPQPRLLPPAVAKEPVPTDAPNPDEVKRIQDEAVEQIKTIFDPEIPVNIYELGLIYGVEVAPSRRVDVNMTLTSPNCPAAQSMPAEVQEKVGAVSGVAEVTVNLVWEPPWGPECMTEEARLELNL